MPTPLTTTSSKAMNKTPNSHQALLELAANTASLRLTLDQPAPSRPENHLIADLMEYNVRQILAVEARLNAKKDDNVKCADEQRKLRKLCSKAIAYALALLAVHGLEPDPEFFKAEPGQAL